MTDPAPQAAAATLPSEFLERLVALVGPEEASRVAATFGADRRPGVWANPLRGATDPVAELAAIGVTGTPCPWLPASSDGGAATIDPADRERVTHSPLVDAGRLYVQNLSSMLAPLVLGVQAGERVLDLAAAPGGKTLHLAAALFAGSADGASDGTLAAVEPVASRLHKLRANLARCGAADVVRTYGHDGREVGRKTPGRFDAVLLDAPCSSEARFDPRSPESLAYWGPRKLAESARKQKSLVRSAIDALRPGGRLLYCTCSFSPEENELVIAHTLKRTAGAVTVEPIAMPAGFAPERWMPGVTAWRGKALPDECARCVRVLPDDYLAGFFLTLLRKG
ncbi:MAG: RsmB/NOP family class I SAM-dependent RNA methyltransferase [Lacipirellulaceae bacterium]